MQLDATQNGAKWWIALGKLWQG